MLAVTPAGFALDREVGAGVEPWPMLRVPMQQVHSWLSIGGHFVLRHHGMASWPAPGARRQAPGAPPPRLTCHLTCFAPHLFAHSVPVYP